MILVRQELAAGGVDIHSGLKGGVLEEVALEAIGEVMSLAWKEFAAQRRKLRVDGVQRAQQDVLAEGIGSSGKMLHGIQV